LREKFFVLDIDYILRENKPIVRLFCKDVNSKTVLIEDSNFQPYFYVMPKEGKLNKLKKKTEKLEEIEKVEIVEKNWKNEEMKLLKIVLTNPRKIPVVRDLIKDWKEVEETYEYDISFYRRYLIDKQIEPMNWIEVIGDVIKSDLEVERIIKAKSVKPIEFDKKIKFKILAFDTEFVEENGEPELIMLSIVCNDNYKKVLTAYEWKKKPSYVESVKNEKEIIEKFLDIVKRKNPDFIVGYNTDRFDFLKLRERAEKLKISLKLGRDSKPIRLVRRGRISSTKCVGRVHIDLFNFIEHILSPSLKSEILTLDEVAQELLGIGKKEMRYKEMVEIWERKKEMKKLSEYSLWDSILTLKLADYILPQIFALCELTGLPPFDTSRYTYSQLVEAFLMKNAFLDNVLIPNHPKQEELQKRRLAPVYKGAIVIEPKKGIHSDILVFDFRSLYPTIIITHNIDPWTLNCNHKECRLKNSAPETKYHFCLKQGGFIPKYLKELIERRKKIKEKMKSIQKNTEEYSRLNNMQYALKIIANACYGYFGFFGARWYKRECGAAAAAWGRFYIKKIIELAKREGFEIIYGDTDSLFLRWPGVK
jgi:DNA polymerase elongation subunit (family B)